MTRKAQSKTIILVCAIIIAGFLILTVFNYHLNSNMNMQNVEKISQLTSEGVYYRIESIFSKPINVSLAMANDSLLKELLNREESEMNSEAYEATMREYLNGYKEKYNYDAVFLVSAQTNCYYNFEGANRVLSPDNGENAWYYNFLSNNQDYSINVDNDEAAHNEITVFINCMVRDNEGNILGIVGVGVRIDYLQSILKEYEEEFGVESYLVDKTGVIQIGTGIEENDKIKLSDITSYGIVLSEGDTDVNVKGEPQYYWEKGNNYVVAQYIPELAWHLVVSHDTQESERQMKYQIAMAAVVALIIMITVILVISLIISRFKKHIVDLTLQIEEEHQNAFRSATEELYDNIYEIDITNNCAASQKTKEFFASLGLSPDASYEDAVSAIAEREIQEEFKAEYLAAFSRENVLKAFDQGTPQLQYDFLIKHENGDYVWTRIDAHINYSQTDQAVIMITYRKNIDEQRRKEMRLAMRVELDSMTRLYNKQATQSHITKWLLANEGEPAALFIIDIDNFKQVNDTYGHAVGDLVIHEFADTIKHNFRDSDIVGRIGGDEFMVFATMSDGRNVRKKAEELSQALDKVYQQETAQCKTSASIGIALTPGDGMDFKSLYKNADQALYYSKEHGKNRFTFYIDIKDGIS